MTGLRNIDITRLVLEEFATKTDLKGTDPKTLIAVKSQASEILKLLKLSCVMYYDEYDLCDF